MDGSGELGSHFLVGLERGAVVAAAVTRLTVVARLVLRLQPRDGQVDAVGGAVDGTRELIQNPRGP